VTLAEISSGKPLSVGVKGVLDFNDVLGKIFFKKCEAYVAIFSFSYFKIDQISIVLLPNCI